LWIGFSVLGFVGAWTAAMVLAATLLVSSSWLNAFRALLSFAIPTPIIGWSPTRVLRRWSSQTRLWVLASAAGWSGFFPVEMLRNYAVPVVDRFGRKLASAIAGHAVASSVGATLLGGAVAE